MKFLFKTLFYLVLTAILLVVCVAGLTVWLAPHYVPPMITNYVEGKTDFKMDIKKMNLSLLNGSMALRGVYLENPDNYNERDFLHIREIGGRVQLTSLKDTNIVVEEAVIDVSNITVVQNPSNHMNVNDFRKGLQSGGTSTVFQSGEPEGSTTPSKAKTPRTYLIKKLRVKLDNFALVGVPDQSSGKQTIPINYERTFTNVTSLEDIADQVGEDLKQYGMQIVMQGLLRQLSPQQMLKNFSDLGIKSVNGVQKTVEQGIKGGAETLKKGVKGLFEGL